MHYVDDTNTPATHTNGFVTCDGDQSLGGTIKFVYPIPETISHFFSKHFYAKINYVRATYNVDAAP
jgi:hypothetical protein